MLLTSYNSQRPRDKTVKLPLIEFESTLSDFAAALKKGSRTVAAPPEVRNRLAAGSQESRSGHCHASAVGWVAACCSS